MTTVGPENPRAMILSGIRRLMMAAAAAAAAGAAAEATAQLA
jgi:hypothetical protein